MFEFVGFFDGACEPRNPGGAMGYGCIIFQNKNRIWKSSGFEPAGPNTSNNCAEYLGLLAILDYFIEKELNLKTILVKGDSQLVIKQCFGHWKIKGGFYADLARQAKQKLERFPQIRGTWIRRELNAEADALSKLKLQQRGISINRHWQ